MVDLPIKVFPDDVIAADAKSGRTALGQRVINGRVGTSVVQEPVVARYIHVKPDDVVAADAPSDCVVWVKGVSQGREGASVVQKSMHARRIIVSPGDVIAVMPEAPPVPSVPNGSSMVV